MRTRDYYTSISIAVLIIIYTLVLYLVATSTIIVIQAIVTTVGILAALFKDAVLKIFFHPDIEIVDSRDNMQIPEPEINQPTQGQTRLIIRNKGNKTAFDVEVQVINIVDPDNRIRKNFLPVPLKWTHDNSARRDIHQKLSVYLDLCRKDNINKQSSYPKLVLAAGEGIFSLEALCEGETKLILMTYDSTGTTKKYEVVINYSLNFPTVKVLSIRQIQYLDLSPTE